jgi:hypothetical protein
MIDRKFFEEWASLNSRFASYKRPIGGDPTIICSNHIQKKKIFKSDCAEDPLKTAHSTIEFSNLDMRNNTKRWMSRRPLAASNFQTRFYYLAENINAKG